MTPEQRMVEGFHRATGGTIGDSPEIRDAALRSELILEEAEEFCVAVGHLRFGSRAKHDVEPAGLVSAIDALCDLLYVVYGAAVTMGVDLEPFFAEVHRSNMTKVGGPVRGDGKRLKPDTYEPPNLGPILEAQQNPHPLLAKLRGIDTAFEIDRSLLSDEDDLRPCPCFLIEQDGFTANGHCWRSCTCNGCCVHVTGDRAVASRLKELLDAMDWYGEWNLVFEDDE